MTSRLRPTRFDDLGLRRALSDRLLPSLVGAMAFLAALALAGALATAGLARHWQEGAGSVLTVQIPPPATPAANGPDPRPAKALAALQGARAVQSARLLTDDELAALLKPWLGDVPGRIALPLPAVIEVHLRGGADPVALGPIVEQAAPGAIIEQDASWAARLALLARSLQACAAAAIAIVSFVAAAVVAVVTRSGLATRRDAIETIHGLGATDAYIATRFARRAMALAGFGALLGTLAALPVLAGLMRLAAPFAARAPEDLLHGTPILLWAALPILPLGASGIGWLTAQATVRRWLLRLP